MDLHSIIKVAGGNDPAQGGDSGSGESPGAVGALREDANDFCRIAEKGLQALRA